MWGGGGVPPPFRLQKVWGGGVTSPPPCTFTPRGQRWYPLPPLGFKRWGGVVPPPPPPLGYIKYGWVGGGKGGWGYPAPLYLWPRRVPEQIPLQRRGDHQREQKAKYLFFGLKESRHTNIFCFYIAFSPTGRNPARRRAAGGGPPSCWVAICWRKCDGKRSKCWCGCSPSMRNINILLFDDATRWMPSGGGPSRHLAGSSVMLMLRHPAGPKVKCRA